MYKIVPSDYQSVRYGTEPRQYAPATVQIGNQMRRLSPKISPEIKARNVNNINFDPVLDAREVVSNAYNNLMSQYGYRDNNDAAVYNSQRNQSEMGNTVSSQMTYGTADKFGLERRASGADAGSNGKFVETMSYSNSGGLNDLIKRYNQTQF